MSHANDRPTQVLSESMKKRKRVMSVESADDAAVVRSPTRGRAA